jgi:two-component system cell cycle response regulator
MELKSRRILTVDTDRDTHEAANQGLTPVGAHLTHVEDLDSTIHRIRAWKPHVVAMNPAILGEGADLHSSFERIRSVSQEDYISIVVLLNEGEMNRAETYLSAGADDFLHKPASKTEWVARLQAAVRARDLHDQYRRSQHRIDELSATDDLTGLANMKFMYRLGEEDIARCRRFKKAVSALIIDIDHFSSVNEAHGFPFGSFVLKQVAQTVKGCVRKVDRVARVGADEYFVLLPETDLAGAEFVAERIRDTVQSQEHRSEKETAKVTVSIGVCGFGPGEESGGITDFFRNSSEALRSAKVAGANRIEVFSFA